MAWQTPSKVAIAEYTWARSRTPSLAVVAVSMKKKVCLLGIEWLEKGGLKPYKAVHDQIWTREYRTHDQKWWPAGEHAAR